MAEGYQPAACMDRERKQNARGEHCWNPWSLLCLCTNCLPYRALSKTKQERSQTSCTAKYFVVSVSLRVELWDLCGMWEGWKGLFRVGRQWQHCWISVACWGASQPLPWSLKRTSEVIQMLGSLSIKVRWSTNSLITVFTRRRGKHSVEFVKSVVFSTLKYTLQSLKVHCDCFPFFILYFRRRKILCV